MASLPFPLDLDFIFTGPYMMIEGGHMRWKGAICDGISPISLRF